MGRMLLVCALALGLLAAVTGAQAAVPSFYGYSGLIVTPTSDALSKGDYSFGGVGIDVDGATDLNIYAANMGLADNLEVGFARIKPDNMSGETWVSTKYRFLEETQTHPAVAAGVFDFTNESDTTAYVVLSKSFAWRSATEYGEVNAPQIHFGVGGGQLDGIFGGVSVQLGDRLLLMGEYDSEDVNVGLRLAITKEIRIHAGLLDGDDLALGISFTKQ